MFGLAERERAFENKFAHDNEIEFKVKTRTIKMLGLWVAGHMSLSAKDAEYYASKAAVSLTTIKEEAIMLRMVDDLHKHGLTSLDEDDLLYEYRKLLTEARSYVMSN